MYTMRKNAVTEFVVVLDEPKKIHGPGGSVHGRVILNLRKKLSKFKQIKLECRGESYVSWPEISGSYTRYCFNREQYFQTSASVYKPETSSSGIPTSNLTPNKYCFSFRFTIPTKVLPPSYEARHGYIRYYMAAVIERGLGKLDVKTNNTVFNVGEYEEYDVEDFNVDAMKQVRDRMEITRTIGWPCYSLGNLSLAAHTDRILYQSGDVITTTVTVGNTTCLDTPTVDVSLIRRTLYNDQRGNKTQTDYVVVSVLKKGPASEENWDIPDVHLTVPTSVYPTMRYGCDCIEVLYYVQVCIKQLKGESLKDASLEIPVIIMCSSSPLQTNSGCDDEGDANKNAVTSSETEAQNKNTYHRICTSSSYNNTGFDKDVDQYDSEFVDTKL